MIKIDISLTKSQIYRLREFVADNGCHEDKGERFYLLAQPIIKDFDTRLAVLLLSEKQGKEFNKTFKKVVKK